MKTLIRIFLILFVLFLVAVGGGYWYVMRPAFQKKLIESKLPTGSSIQSVQITTNRVELAQLKLVLADGTTAKVDHAKAGFSPLAAVFRNTIQMSDLQVEGLVVKLPEALIEEPAGSAPVREVSSVDPEVSASRPAVSSEAPGSPMDALYALGELDWLFDVDSIRLDGALIDPARNRYTFEIQASPIAPNVETTLTASLKLESKQALQGGLKDFVSDLQLHFKQNGDGGFEHLRLNSQTSGSDASGAKLLSSAQALSLSIQAFDETAQLELSFQVDLPHPEVFAPELIALQGLSIDGELNAAADGSALTLNTANLDAASNGAQVVSVKLKQRMTLGGQQQLSGELMDIHLMQLPIAWLNPWIGDGWALSGAPVSAQVLLTGGSHGALQVQTLAPLQVGPVSLSHYEQLFFENLSLRMNPSVRVAADQSIDYDLGDFQVIDRYGEVLGGTISGSKHESSDRSPFAGLQTRAKLKIGLAELLQQPALAGMASVLAGQANVVLDIDGAAEYPAKLQAGITGLRARDLPGSSQNYRFAAQLKQINGGGFALGSNFAAGSENRPSTSVQIAGQVMPESQPMPFKVELTAPRIAQSDLDLLMAAFQAEDRTQSAGVTAAPAKTSSVSKPSGSSATVPVQVSVERPPWADLNGDVAIKIDELTMPSGQIIRGLSAQAKITEALLAVRDMKASMEGGRVSGQGEVRFDPALAKAYKLSSVLSFSDVDPSIFSKKKSGNFPVQGLFDGDFSFSGSGATLEAAVDSAEGDLLITGRNGVLTAFELDNRSQLGLIGAGLLGQSLNRPGVTALAQAVPYFKDMRFETFSLKLTRAQDKKVKIPELSLIGDNLRINGSGFIAASSLSEVLDQPLDLTLGLGAKGRLVDYLETLQLLGPQTSEDGFRNWNKDIKIGGTLADPNTDQLMDMLNAAARRALTESESKKSKSTATSTSSDGQLLLPGDQASGEATTNDASTETPKKKSKEEKIIDDIEMGVDLLNSVFGQ